LSDKLPSGIVSVNWNKVLFKVIAGVIVVGILGLIGIARRKKKISNNK